MKKSAYKKIDITLEENEEKILKDAICLISNLKREMLIDNCSNLITAEFEDEYQIWEVYDLEQLIDKLSKLIYTTEIQ